MKKTNRIFTILIFIFLYIPMAVLIVASFNTGKDIAHFDGFTLNRYVELFQDEHLLQLLRNSMVVSILATAISTVFGTVAAVGIHNLKPKMRSVVMSLTNIPMTNPDIVTGVSLSLLFVFVGTKIRIVALLELPLDNVADQHSVGAAQLLGNVEGGHSRHEDHGDTGQNAGNA